MCTPIAGRRRLCQAAAMAALHLCLCVAAWGQASVRPQESYFEAGTPDGVVVKESCEALLPGPRETPCGALANKAVDVITRLTALLGPFPQKTLLLEYATSKSRVPDRFVVSTHGRIRAAPQMMAFAGGNLYVPDFLPREVARQWFLAPDSRWGRDETLLAEGLPEYLAWRYLREANPEAARALVEEAMRDFVAGSSDASVFAFAGEPGEERDTRIVSSRRRGLLVLRTLETVIDRERVDRVLPVLIQRSREVPLSAALLEKVCEEIAGRNLKWFFDYFVQGRQIPTIELRRLPSESPGVAAGEILMKNFPPEGSVRVEMTVRTAQGIVEHSVATRGAVTPFSVNVPAPALGITLDPDLRILRWTEAAERSKAQSALLAELPNSIRRKSVPAAIELHRRALAADPGDASLRAQCLHERLGELEWAHDEWDAALADLDAAINGHSLGPFETYLCRGKAYLYHGVVQLHERRPKEALKDAQAGLALPRVVLLKDLPEEPIESQRHQTLEQLLDTLINAATHY